MPPREYTLQYDKDRLKRMAQNEELNKEDTALVAKDRFVEKGDVECAYCDFSEHCYSSLARSEADVKQQLYLDTDKILHGAG